MPGSLPAKTRNESVQSLLDRIRHLLGVYILWDCAAILVGGIVLWILASVIFDHGLFRFFGIDLVLDSPVFLRSWQKWGLIAILALLLVPRLFLLLRKKTDADLAMVLEKKLPGAFRESLLTTLDLSDAEKIRSSGYSPALVEESRKQAEKAAAGVDAASLISWSRLYKRLGLAGFMALGIFPLLCGWTALEREVARNDSASSRSLVGETLDTLGFWWERTVTGSEIAWPREAFARIAGFPANGRRKVGKSAPFTVQVNAYRFVIAGKPGAEVEARFRSWLLSSGASPETVDDRLDRLRGTCENGWRPLTWFDAESLLPDHKDLFSSPLPNSGFWLGDNQEAPGLLDELARLAGKSVARTKAQEPGADNLDLAGNIQKVVEQLEEKAKASRLGRKVRILGIPEKVTLSIAETPATGEPISVPPKPVSHTLSAEQNAPGIFIHRIQSVPGDLDLRVAAANHLGPNRFLVAVQPTPFAKLLVTEVRPAYLKNSIDPSLSGPSRDKALAELAARKDLVELGDRLGTRADETELVFPAGSEIRLGGELPGDRKWGQARLEWGTAKEQSLPIPNKLALQGDRNLTLETGKVLLPSIFRFVLEDADGIKGERKLRLTPVPDEPPTLEVRPSDDLRETEKGYVSTAGGRIPWTGASTDKQGLGRLYQVYSVRVAREEGVSLSLAGSIGMSSSGGFARLFPIGQIGSVLSSGPGQRAPRRVAALLGVTAQPGSGALVSLPGLLQTAMEGMPVERTRLLPGFVNQFATQNTGGGLNQFSIEPDRPGIPPLRGNDFPLALALESRGPGEAIEFGRTVVDLRLEAEDLDVVTTAEGNGPGQPHRTSTAGVVIRIISDDDMLDLLQGDFLRLRAQVQEARDLLLPADPSIKTPVRHLFELQGVESELRETENRLDPRRRDGDSITRLLEEVRGRGREIEQAYQRLLRQTALAGFEVKREQTLVAGLLGQLNREMIGALEGGVEQFNRARDANAPMAERLVRMRDASGRARELIRFFDQILDAMGGASDLNREVARLRGILREQESQARRLEVLRKDLVNRLLDDLLKP